ncbi:MAG: serine hydrolase [Pseudomonadota bacterium]
MTRHSATRPIAMPRSIAALALAPALALMTGCGAPVPDEEAPLTDAARNAVTANAGAPNEELARAIDDLFAKQGIGETRAVVLYVNGKLAAERYGEGYDPKTRFISWSMAKTVTAVLVGMLVADGRLSLDEPAPVPMWQRSGDPREAITLRHLLQMSSGLDHTEAGDPPYHSSEVRMLFLDGRDDMARWAKEQPLEAEPGTKFEYSSNTTVILADIVARALTESEDPDARREAVDNFMKERLFGPLGMTSMVPEYDASGTLIGGSLMHATARDYARFGEFMRARGANRAGVQLVPADWIAQMIKPSDNASYYGFQTWLNRPDDRLEDGAHPLFPKRAPHSLFSLIGHMGQYVLVSPEQKVTMVRLGHSASAERPPMLQEMADVLELYPTPRD